MNYKILAYLIGLLCLSTTSWASVLGLPQHTVKFGVASGAGIFQVSDPNGATDRSLAVQPIQVIVSDWLVGPSKYWVSFYTQEFVLAASEENIGQAVNQNGIRAVVQHNLPLHRNWMPWLGVGFDLSYGEYRLRHHMDNDGFLTQRFDDRDSVNVGAIFSVTNEWQVSRHWSAGFQFEQVLPLGNASRSSVVTAILMYNL